MDWEKGYKLSKKYWIENEKFNEKPGLSKLIPKASKVALDLITRMLSMNPNDRPTIKQIMADEFFHQNTPDSNYSYSTNDSLDNEIIKNELKIISDNNDAGKPNHDSAEPSSNKLKRNKERSIKAKDIIRKKLMRIGKLNNLELSNVVETDRESVGENSPMRVHKPKASKKKSKFENINPSGIADNDKNSLPSIPSSQRDRASSQNQRGGVTLAKYQRNPSSLGLKKYASQSLLTQHNMGSNFNQYNVQPVNFAEPLESSEDELDVLRKQMDSKSSSLPVSMNNIGPVTNRYSSRGSTKLEVEPNSRSNVDKYFMDLNGKSLINNTDPSGDIFSNINMPRQNSMQRSLMSGSGSTSSRRINAANQILFPNSHNYNLRLGNVNSRQSSIDTYLSGKQIYIYCFRNFYS